MRTDGASRSVSRSSESNASSSSSLSENNSGFSSLRGVLGMLNLNGENNLFNTKQMLHKFFIFLNVCSECKILSEIRESSGGRYITPVPSNYRSFADHGDCRAGARDQRGQGMGEEGS